MAAMDGRDFEEDCEQDCDEGNEGEDEVELAHAQDPDVEEDRAFGSWGEGYSDQEVDDPMDEEDAIPAEPDIEWYLSLYDIPDATRVSICRTYASYLVAKGKTGVHKPGPPSTLKKKAMAEGRWSS